MFKFVVVLLLLLLSDNAPHRSVKGSGEGALAQLYSLNNKLGGEAGGQCTVRREKADQSFQNNHGANLVSAQSVSARKGQGCTAN